MLASKEFALQGNQGFPKTLRRSCQTIREIVCTAFPAITLPNISIPERERPIYDDASDKTTPCVGFLVTQKGLRATDVFCTPAWQRDTKKERKVIPELQRAVEIRSRTILDEADRKYGCRCACSALPTLDQTWIRA
jgi:hypothetical protein